MIKRKIFLTSSILLISSSLLFTAGTPVFANENTEVTLSQPINENITEQELTEGFNQLASLTIDDLITMLKQHGVDPSTVFTAQEIASARSQEMLRAGRNTVLNVNNETKDVYINSYIATTAKTLGFAAVVHYVGLGWLAQAVTGSIAANINTSKGIIVRINKQPGWKWGSNIDRWVIIGVRSQ